MKKNLIIVFVIALLSTLSIDPLQAQVKPQPFAIRDEKGIVKDIDHVILKADHKTHEFKMDTTSADYKSLSQIDPNWIEKIDFLENKRLEGGAKKVVIITLKEGKINAIPNDLNHKFK